MSIRVVNFVSVFVIMNIRVTDLVRLKWLNGLGVHSSQSLGMLKHSELEIDAHALGVSESDVH